jgi:very-short-patch-repair endonuclease
MPGFIPGIKICKICNEIINEKYHCSKRHNLSKREDVKLKISKKNMNHPVSKKTRKAVSDSNKRGFVIRMGKEGAKIALEKKRNNMKGKNKQRANKTWEEIFGLEKTKELKEKAKIRHLGKSYITEIGRKKISIANTGRIKSDAGRLSISVKAKERLKDKTKHSMFNKRHKESSKKIIREKRMLQIMPFKDTTIEVKIQNYLKDLGIEYFTHQWIKSIKHDYQCDILIPSLNMVIECDGNYWHKYPVGNNIDHIRTKELLEKGFKVLRLWEIDIWKMDIEEFENRLGDLS